MSARRVGAAILLLVGPKGSGKTTLGRALGELPGATFLDVEAVARILTGWDLDEPEDLSGALERLPMELRRIVETAPAIHQHTGDNN